GRSLCELSFCRLQPASTERVYTGKCKKCASKSRPKYRECQAFSRKTVDFKTKASIRRRSAGRPAAREARLDLLQVPLEKPALLRVLQPAAVDIAADDRTRRLELVHVLEDESTHMPCPRGGRARIDVALERFREAQRERQVVQPVLGDDRRMREPRPAPVGIGKELASHELEHAARLRGIGDFGVDAAGREQRVLPGGVELENAIEPRLDPTVIQITVRERVARAVIRRLKVQHEQLRKGDRL